MSMNYAVVHGLDFSESEISDCLAKKGILTLELEFTKRCNLRCIYCYAEAGEPKKDELAIEEIKDIILQAKNLGAKRIILLGGGEPLLYEGIETIIKYIKELGLKQSIFTNGTLLTERLSRFLYDHEVDVIIKHNSNIPAVQDLLAGVSGTYEKINNGLNLLIEAGYPNGKQLGIQTVICRQNHGEIPEMWKWAREKNIIPYFEIMTYQGRAREHPELLLEVDDIREIFDALQEIDEKKFGVNWSSHPTIASFTCKRHLYSCLVNSEGYIQPCTGIDINIGSVRKQPLKDILAGSKVIWDLRNIYKVLKGPCRTCEYNGECYGCRGNAYQITGDYRSSDPACWIYKTHQKSHKT